MFATHQRRNCSHIISLSDFQSLYAKLTSTETPVVVTSIEVLRKPIRAVSVGKAGNGPVSPSRSVVTTAPSLISQKQENPFPIAETPERPKRRKSEAFAGSYSDQHQAKRDNMRKSVERDLQTASAIRKNFNKSFCSYLERSSFEGEKAKNSKRERLINIRKRYFLSIGGHNGELKE